MHRFNEERDTWHKMQAGEILEMCLKLHNAMRSQDIIEQYHRGSREPGLWELDEAPTNQISNEKEM